MVVHQFHRLVNVCRAFNLHRFSQKHALLYTGLLLLIAVVGFAYLLLFPALVVFGLMQLSQIAANSILPDTYMSSLFWYALVVFSIGISYHIFTIQFALPKGFALEHNKTTAKLFGVARPQGKGCLYPCINKIILSDQCEFELVKHPVSGIPFWTNNVLVVGFGFMQSLPPNYFNSAVIEKLLQFSKRKHPLINWLSQLGDIWQRYPLAFKQRNKLGDKFIYWFFNYYSTLYLKFSVHLTNKAEMLADSLALQYVNDLDLAETIEAQMVLRQFFSHTYWPTLNHLIKRNRVDPNEIRPFSALPAAIQKALTREKIVTMLKEIYANPASINSSRLTLQARMENIGHSRVRVPTLSGVNSAEYYFEHDYEEVVRLMDSYWAHNVIEASRGTKSNTHKPLQEASVNIALASN